MTDLEYLAKTLVEAVRTGDVPTLELLCDMAGVTPLRPSAEGKAMADEMQAIEKQFKQSILRCFGVPAELLQGGSYINPAYPT
jgi:hypothetical protein